MALRVISTSTELSSYTQRTILDGVEYLLTFQWNVRENSWGLSIADAAGVAIASGLKVVCSWPITRLIKDDRWTGGYLFALDTTGGDSDPGLTDLGDRVLLCYVPAADVILQLGLTPEPATVIPGGV